jgi:Flp pilus assembly protein TadG
VTTNSGTARPVFLAASVMGEQDTTRKPARLRRRCLGDRGAASVEFALILPVLLLVLFGIVQFGLLFSVQNQMVNAAREAARAMAVEGATETEGENLAMAHLSAYGDMNFTVDAVDADPANGNPDVSVTVQVPATDAVVVDVLGLFGGRNITQRIVMRQEQS